MTRHELKLLILECIDEKMDDIVEKVIKNFIKINSDVFIGDKILDIKEAVTDLRKDIDYIADKKLNIPYGDLPSSDLPF